MTDVHKKFGPQTFLAKCEIFRDSLDALRRIEHLDPDSDDARQIRFRHEQITQQTLTACERLGREGWSE